MDILKPKLLTTLKNYNIKMLHKDMMAGIIVAIIALPLSIAFALASGVSAEKGIYSSIISSLIIAILGGSNVQITGPTGAFIIITHSIINKYGLDGLMIATILAGFFLLLMGVFHLGKLIKYIPSPITIGFTGGIAISIFTLEIKDMLGLTITNMPTNFFGKWQTYLTHLSDINWQGFVLSIFSLGLLILWPRINRGIPNSFVTIVVGSLLAYFLGLDVKILGEIPKTISLPELPKLKLDDIFNLIQPALTIAILVAMQALLSAVVTDNYLHSKHRSNMELIAQGTANLLLGILGCIPATGGVARSIANAKNGGSTPIAAVFHSLTLLLFLFVFMPLIQYIPLSVLAAVIIEFSYRMFNIKAFLSYKKAPKSDLVILITSCILTFAFDLILAIEIGIIMACILFMKRMADVTSIRGWEYIEENEVGINSDSDNIRYKQVPPSTLVYEISGPMFFGASDKFLCIQNISTENIKTIIIRMRSVPAMDISAMNALSNIHNNFKKKGITLIFSHVMPQPYSVMSKVGFIEEAGKHNFCENIDVSLKRAAELSQIPCKN